MFHRMPWAPLMSTSSSGLAMAIRAASTARFSPLARPMPMSAEPASFMIARTSAKSWLIKPGHRDDVADALDALAQDVVDDPERVEDAGVLLDDVAEPVVRDRDEGVDLALQLLGRLLGDELALVALERERLGHDADRQRAAFLGDLGDHRGRARTRAPAEAGRDEDHVRVGERLGDLLRVLFGRSLADRGVAARSETARDLVADPDLVRGIGLEEGLRVRVAGDELHAHHLGADHPVDGIAASAPDTDDADQREVLGVGTQRHRESSIALGGRAAVSESRRLAESAVHHGCSGGARPASRQGV